MGTGKQVWDRQPSLDVDLGTAASCLCNCKYVAEPLEPQFPCLQNGVDSNIYL